MTVVNKPSATLVIGCHRSGTSLITRCLSAMGLSLADDLIPARPDNPKGFWEDAGVTAFNESLLNTFQCDWNSVNFIKLDNIRGQRVTQWREKALALIQDHYPADGNFVIKDPKFSLLIPFWQEVFNELEIGTRFLLTYRPPLSVAASLKARNGFSREKSVLIWLAYYHACLKTIPQASPVSVVSYDLFMQHPVDQSKRIQRQLGIDNVDWPSISTFLNDFPDPSLRHHQADGQVPLPGFTRGLMEHLEHLCHLEDVRSELRNSRHAVVDEERLNVRLGEFIADDRFRLNLRLRAQNEQYEQRTAELAGWKQEADRVAKELSSNTEKYELQISRMLTELAAANTDWQQEVDSLNSLMAEKEAAFNQEQLRLNAELAESNTVWQQEVDQLNSLMHDKDQSARSELDSLNQLLEEKEAAFNQEQQRLTNELTAANNAWQQEVDSLNNLMVDKDQSARSELDSLNQLLAEKEAAFNQDQQRLNAELAESNTIWKQEVDQLNSLMHDKDQSAQSELDSLNQLLEEKEAAFNQEQQRLTDELTAANSAWQQEVDSLNNLMVDKDQSARSELDSLNQLLEEKEAAFNQDQQRLNAELTESNTDWQQEIDQLNSLMHDKDQSARSELDNLNQLLEEKEAAFNQEQLRLNAELADSNTVWQQEVDSLNNLMVDKDQSARSELDSLNQLLEEKEAAFNQEQQRLNAELAESNTIWKQEVDQLNSLMHDKDQSAQSELDSLNHLMEEKEAAFNQVQQRLTEELTAANSAWQQEVDSLNNLMVDKDQSARSELDSLNQLLEEKEAAFNQEQQRLNAELAESNNVWQQEVDNLNSLMIEKDQTARSELDQLNHLLEEKEAAFNEEQQRLNAELAESNTIWKQEVDQLNSLMHDKDQSAQSELDSLNHLMEEKEAAFNQEQQRLTDELAAVNTVWQQEVDNLNHLMNEKDQSARREFDQLNHLLEENEAAFNQEQQRLNAELSAAKTEWQQEVDSLNSLMIDKDQSAQSELDSLNHLMEEKEATFNQEQQRLNAELSAAKTEWQQEVDSLNSLMIDKDQSAQSELDSLNHLMEEKEATFNQEQQRLNAELSAAKTEWQQEVDSLNSLMIEKDQIARSELDQLNHLMEEKEATFNQEQQRLNAELNAAKTEWQQEVDSLNSLMNDKDQSAQSEFDRLNGLLIDTDQSAQSEFDRLNGLLIDKDQSAQSEFDRLNHLLEEKEAAFNQEQQRLTAELTEVRRSYSYRLGRFITWPVRRPFVSLVLPLFRNRHTVRLALTMAGQALRHPLNGLKLLSLRRIRNTMVIVYRRPELGMQVFGHYTDQLQGENQRTPALPVSTGTEIKGEPGKISLAFELPEEPRVSVIIPVYNQLDFTLGCLQSIVEHKSTCSFEIIVADDCSTDDTGDVIPRIPGVRYIRNPKNLGFIRSCNHASEHARGEFVFFLNNDTQVTAGWLDSLAAVFDQHWDAGIVGSRLLFPDGKLQEAGGIVWDDGSGWNFGRLDDPEKPEFNYLKEVDYVSGAALMIRRSLLTTLGRFDERFVPAYYEDTDLAFAVRDAGYKVFMQPRSNIVHFEGVTNGTETGSGIKRYQVENQGKFLAKWQSVLSRDHFPNAENLFLARDRSRFKTTVLVVDHYVPHYDRDAGSRSTWQYLQLMVSAGFNIKFIGDNFFRHEPYATELENMGIEVLCGNDYARNWQQWIIDNAPAIDVIYLQRPHISENYLPVINQLEHRPKIIYFGHDLHFLRLERQHEVERDPQLASEAAQWKQREFDIFHQVDLVYYPSEVEVSRIKQEMPQAQVKAIPLYIFKEDGTEDFDPEERKDLLFVGGFNHTPNVDAVKWFIQQVFPQVNDSLPDVKLHVVGSNMPADINDLGGGNVIMHGFLEDEQLDALYSSIRLSVVPLRYGAGVKGKVLESMHKGVPVLTTSIGAEGIPQAEDCMCVSSIDDYGPSVIRLYQDSDELSRMSNSARLLISQHFSVQAASDAILDDFGG